MKYIKTKNKEITGGNMFLINVKVLKDKLPQGKEEELFDIHRKWFTNHFNEGDFIMLGPYLDAEGNGILITPLENKKEVEELIKGDIFYIEEVGEYEIREFKAAMISDKITNYRGK